MTDFLDCIRPGKEYGRTLRDMRVSAGLSLRDAARIVGLSDVEYGAVERGVRTLDLALEHLLVGHIVCRRSERGQP